MRLAVMQPYFFPYIGYYQLVGAVDIFVFFNDVNFIKKGWINRNSILHQKQPQLFSIPLVKASQNKKINEVEIFEYSLWRQGFLDKLEYNYRKSACFNDAFMLIQEILYRKEFLKIDELAAHSVIEVSKYVGLETRFMFSSDLDYKGTNGQDKVLDICQKLKASVYINPQNGAFQYADSAFNANHIDLFFLAPVSTEYTQTVGNEFVPWLSMIDILMFNSREETLAMIRKNVLHKRNMSD
jgi:hypothetical protein